MKKFIYRILLFVLPAISVLAIVDFVYSKAAAKSNYFSIEAWYDLMNGNIDADVIVMGSSRAWVHVNPQILDSVLNTTTYNIGIDGSCINRQIHKYNVFRNLNRKPKLIIQNIDQASLGYTKGYQKAQIFPYFWNSEMRSEMYASEALSVWEKYIPLYRFYRNFDRATLNGMIKNTKRTLTNGYEGKNRHWDGTAFSKVKSIKFNVNDTTLTMFDEYLAKAKAEGINIVFVYTPLFNGAIKKMENIEEMYATYQRLADKYDIPILNYWNMDICSDTAYFYNAMHLNKRGAEIFSDSLANDIKRLGILNR